MTAVTRLVIASGNPHKVDEIRDMLGAINLEVLAQPRDLEIEETGHTYGENARLKAETVARLTGEWALADDSGLEVDALGGRPGLFSARYAPDDTEKVHRLLQELGDSLYRGARFVSAMALADPLGTTRLEGCGVCYGLILREPDSRWGQATALKPIHAQWRRVGTRLSTPGTGAVATRLKWCGQRGLSEAIGSCPWKSSCTS